MCFSFRLRSHRPETMQNKPAELPPLKKFSIRPHTPLVPLFQLPSDHSNAESGSSSTVKRSLYRKPKMLLASGKYYGADDDLKLLNVIESFCRIKASQSVKVNRKSWLVRIKWLVTFLINTQFSLWNIFLFLNINLSHIEQIKNLT